MGIGKKVDHLAAIPFSLPHDHVTKEHARTKPYREILINWDSDLEANSQWVYHIRLKIVQTAHEAVLKLTLDCFCCNCKKKKSFEVHY